MSDSTLHLIVVNEQYKYLHKLCEDGLCRKECPNYGGCPNDKPLLCPIGICVKFESECAGISNCPIDSPIRCLDGSCANKIQSI